MQWTSLSLIILLPLTGCSSHGLPPVKQIAQIRLTITHMPDEKGPLPTPRVVNLSEQKDIVEMMDYLHTIDWSQSGADLSVVGVPQTDGNIILIDKSGAPNSYSFYWDGKFVHNKAHRLIHGGDTEKLKQLVKRVCK